MAWAPDNVRKWSTLTLLALMGTTLTAAINPGFSAIIFQKGLDFGDMFAWLIGSLMLLATSSLVAESLPLGHSFIYPTNTCQEGVTELQKELETIKVPNFSGIFKTKHLGKGSYEFYSMTVDGFHTPNPQIRLLLADKLQLSIKNASINIRGRWKSKKNFLKARGKFDLSLQGVFISADLQLGRSPPGRLRVDCSACSSHIDRVHIQISGSMLGWLIQLFHKKIETSLKNSINEKICRIVTISVSTKLQPYIHTLPVVARVDEMTAIDYSLLTLRTTVEFLEGQLKGEFFWRRHHDPLPITPPAMSVSPNKSYMVQLGISEYFFNTAGLAYQESGTLQMTLRDWMLPKDSKFRLNTEFLGTFLPKVALKFPSTEVQLLISVSSPPRLSIQPSGLLLDPALETQAFVVLPNSSLIPLFLVHMNTTASLEVDAEADRLVGEMKMEKLTLELKQSEFGSFKVELLQAVINYLMPTIVLPKINERLRKGFPLPLPAGVRLNNPVFQSYQNFLVLGADVHRT